MPGSTARSNWTVRTIATRLSDERRRLDWLQTGDLAVRACFEVSFTSLPGPGRGRGRPGARIPPARAVAGVVRRAARRRRAARPARGEQRADALEVLVNAQLLQSPAADRYRFHDLLKAYAAERAVAEETARHAGRGRAPGALLVPAHRGGDGPGPFPAPRAEYPGAAGTGPVPVPLTFSTVDAALDWCEQERTNLVAATRQAAASRPARRRLAAPGRGIQLLQSPYLLGGMVVETHRRRAGQRAPDRRSAGRGVGAQQLGMAYARRRMEEGVRLFRADPGHPPRDRRPAG